MLYFFYINTVSNLQAHSVFPKILTPSQCLFQVIEVGSDRPSPLCWKSSDLHKVQVLRAAVVSSCQNKVYDLISNGILYSKL